MSTPGGISLATLGLRVDAQGFVRDVKTARSEVQKLEASGEKAASSMKRAFLGLTAGIGLGLAVHKMIAETSVAQDSMAQLEAAIESTGGAAGRTVKQIDDLASEIQKTTRFADDTARSAATLLTAFKSISGDIFDRTVKISADMAARTKDSLEGAVMQIGKALEDPIRGLTLLRRAGVTFTESQENVIKKLFETGEVAKAQTMILDELASKYGGAAAASRDTVGGMLDAIKNDFGDLFEVSRGGSQLFVDVLKNVDETLLFLKEHINQVHAGTVALFSAVAAGASVYIGLALVTKTAAAWQAILTGVEAIRGFIALARSVRTLADTMALLSLVSKGAVGAIAAIVAAGVGFAAYRKVIKELNEASEEFARKLESQVVTTNKLGDSTRELTDEERKRAELLKQQTTANEDMIRMAEQNAHLSGMEGDAQERLRIEYDALNKSIAARREVLPEILDATLRAIEIEKQWALAGLDAKTALDAQRKALEDAKTIREEFIKSSQNAMAGGIERMLTDGLDGFKSFFEEVKRMFLRMVAEMIAARAMKELATSLVGILGTATAAGALQVTPVTPPFIQGVQNRPEVITGYNPIVASASSRNLLGYGAAAFGGFGVGYQMGNSYGGAGGVAGGIAGGAAQGAMIGSVLPGIGTAAGAAVGAITGLIGGIVGAGKAAEETERAVRAFWDSLQKMSDSLHKSPLEQELAELERQKAAAKAEAKKTFFDEKEFDAYAEAIKSINQLYGEAADRIREEADLKQKEAQEDYQVRQLYAEGRVLEAEAAAFAQEQHRELMEAIRNGADAATLAALMQAQAAEANRRAAEILEANKRQWEDLEVRLVSANNAIHGFSDAQAQSMAFLLSQERELMEARLAGASPEMLALLKQVHELEKEAREEELRQANERASQDIEVRRLVAAGLDDAATILQFQLQQQREYQDAVLAGLDATTLLKLEMLQTAELAKFLEEIARAAAEQAQGFKDDLSIRRARLGGNEEEVIRAEHAVSAAKQLEDARRLLEAGRITQDLFNELADILDDELAAALKGVADAARDAAAAAREAAEAQELANIDADTRLDIRRLRAEGKNKEAAEKEFWANFDKEYNAAVEANRGMEYLNKLVDTANAEFKALMSQFGGEALGAGPGGGGDSGARDIEAADTVRGVMALGETTGVRIADMLTAIQTNTYDTAQNTKQMTIGGVGGSGVTVNATLNFYGDVSTLDASQLGNLIGQGIIDQIDSSLAQKTETTERGLGSAVIE